MRFLSQRRWYALRDASDSGTQTEAGWRGGRSTAPRTGLLSGQGGAYYRSRSHASPTPKNSATRYVGFFCEPGGGRLAVRVPCPSNGQRATTPRRSATMIGSAHGVCEFYKNEAAACRRRSAARARASSRLTRSLPIHATSTFGRPLFSGRSVGPPEVLAARAEGKRRGEQRMGSQRACTRARPRPARLGLPVPTTTTTTTATTKTTTASFVQSYTHLASFDALPLLSEGAPTAPSHSPPCPP